MTSAEVPTTQSKPRRSTVAGWALLEFEEVDSTNLVAGKLNAWHAVRADTQSAGRGRFQRSWVSDAGGLWLSAVVPTGSDRRALPLVAGLAVIESLKQFGVSSARLRWPNDIMVNDRKLAGLLVDTFSPQCAVIGIGVNVTNQPEKHDSALKDVAIRLADLVPQTPSLPKLTESILTTLRVVVQSYSSRGFSAVRDRINQLWGPPRQVAIDLDGVQQTGLFTGVDDDGRLLLQGQAPLQPHQVKLLRELS
jgi:BirA family biotin operon repressor/biotin-[acetyl-CoA-carboxylase] ligase